MQPNFQHVAGNYVESKRIIAWRMWNTGEDGDGDDGGAPTGPKGQQLMYTKFNNSRSVIALCF